MPAKTNKQRQAEWKASQRAKGLKRVPDIWARPEDHDAILGAAMAIISDTTSAKVGYVKVGDEVFVARAKAIKKSKKS